MQQSEINANFFRRDRQRLRCFTFTRKDGIPLSGFILDGTRFDAAFNRSMELDLNGADFRERDALLREGIAPLRVGETVIAIASLKARIARLFASFDPSEKGLEGSFQTQEDILKHLRMDILVLFSQDIFDLRKIALLFVVADRLASHAICLFPFGKASIVQFSTPCQCPEEDLLLLGGRVEPIFESLSHRFFCPST